MTTLEHAHQTHWQTQLSYAERMTAMIAELNRKHGTEVFLRGMPLSHASALDILSVDGAETSPELDTYVTLLHFLSLTGHAPRTVDLTHLVETLADKEKTGYAIRQVFDREYGEGTQTQVEPRDVVLYGFGRIGRLLARLLIEQDSPKAALRLRAIVVRRGGENDLDKRVSLLIRDSVHGAFKGSVTVDRERNVIKANGTYIKIIYANDPSAVNYTEHGIQNALIVDNTGVWKDEKGLGQHLIAPGAGKVLLTAPADGDIKNIVHGVNEGDIEPTDTILCAASCTTNAITPVLKALHDSVGIEDGHVETVHAYTNDQNLIDNYHKGDRRGRSAALNMVLTSTGAAKAVAKAFPALKGKLTGNAIRVPTPNVSMAILNLNLAEAHTTEELNALLKNIANHHSFRAQVGYTDSTEVVSSDLVGHRQAGVVDSQATIANGKRAVIYVWYDNEFGYSCQVMRVMKSMLA